MPNKPIIITAFANDYENGQHLQYLSDEIDGINNALNGRKLRSFFDVITINKASLERISEKLEGVDYQNRIVAFHYGGHADSQHLMLQNAKGTTELAKAETLANFLGKQERLQLVFLNGCSTEGQVKKLKEAGIHNIIATDRSIDDAEASRFAVEFYKALAAGERNISTLFKEAQKTIENERIRASVKRRVYSGKETSKNNFSWGLHELEGSPKEGLGEWFVNRNIDLLTKAAPSPTEAFIGRNNDLKKVHKLLKENNNVVLVNGIGGIGKSTLAQAYWHKHQHQYAYLAYVVVTNDNIQEAFLNSGLEQKLNIQIPEKSTMEERYKVLQRELSALQGIKLLIVDNINEPDAVHQFKLPNWKVMMASRASIEHYTQYTVGMLSEADAQTLFLHYHPTPDEKLEVLELLLEGIGYHTLTIELLAKNLQQLKGKGYDISDLYQNLKEKGLLNPDKSRKIRVDYPTEQKVKYEKVIEAMFDLNPLVEHAQWLLLQFAVLPAIPISYVDMKDFLLIKEEMEEQFDETLEDLVERGWLEKKESGYKMHQVVQEVIKEKIEPNGENCEVLVIGLAWKLKIHLGQNPLKNSPYLAYTNYLLTRLKHNNNRSIVLLFNNTALVYQETGAFTKSVELNLKSIKIQQSIYPIEYSDIAAAYNNIAINYRSLGNYDESIEYNLKSIKLREKVLSPQHPDLALSYCNIGDVYQVLGFFDKALKFQLKSISIREKILTALHPDLGQSYNNIAVIYRRMGTLNKAIDYQLKSIKIAEKNSELKHKLATSYDNLGETYREMGNIHEALSFQKKALAIREDIFKTKHPDLVTSYNNIALCYQALKKYTIALNFLLKAIEIHKEIFKNEHSDLASLYSNIAIIYQELKQVPKSIDFQLKAIRIRKRFFDSKHPLLAQSYFNIAVSYFVNKNIPLAKSYIEKSVPIYKHNFPNGHPQLKLVLEWQKCIRKMHR